MNRETPRGICGLCGESKAKRAMTAHLKACAPRHDRSKGSASELLQIRVEGRYDPVYWLDIEVRARTNLRAVDSFLRDIWLECCGHMSAFVIDGIRYSVFVDREWGFELGERSMDQRVGEVLGGRGQRFRYEYDSGSTTELVLRVWGEREGRIGRSPVRLLARNEAPVWPCGVCGEPAEVICGYCGYERSPFYCAEHTSEDASEHEDAFLPVVNSPRMGVCAYAG